MNIDAHQHFWHYSPQEYGWIDDSMSDLQRDFLPKDLEKELIADEIDGSICVQARQSLQETRWLLELAQQHSFIKGVVGWVDLRSENIDEQLREFADDPKFVGVRHVVQDEPDDLFLLREDFMRGIAKLHRYDLTYDILIFPKHLPTALEFVEKFPEQRFVLDHIAKPFIKTGVLEPWQPHMEQLAAFPNVYCKISGMVTEADWQHWTPAEFYPYLDVIFESFGPNRLLFGSDWPVCTVAASYANVVDILSSYLEERSISPAEAQNIWGTTAIKFYNLNL